MQKRVLVIKNVERESLGTFQDSLSSFDLGIDTIEVEQGDEVPASLDGYSVLLILGGPSSANDDTEAMRRQLRLTRQAVVDNVPFFGICLGMQILMKAVGGEVVTSTPKEIGFWDSNDLPYTVQLTGAGKADPLLKNVPDVFPVFQLHGETVEPPADTVLLATNDAVRFQLVKVGKRAYGAQFHLEVTPQLLERWLDEDPELADHDHERFQARLFSISNDYRSVASAVFKNFSTLAGLTPG